MTRWRYHRHVHWCLGTTARPRRNTARSAEHGWFLAAALTVPPQHIAADTSQSLTAVGELHLGVRHTVVAPARAPVASARNYYYVIVRYMLLSFQLAIQD